MDKQLTAQQLANKRQDAKRASQPRVNGFYVTEDEIKILEALAEKYGSRKVAIIEGLKLLHQQALD
jgi:hypothetical protein